MFNPRTPLRPIFPTVFARRGGVDPSPSGPRYRYKSKGERSQLSEISKQDEERRGEVKTHESDEGVLVRVLNENILSPSEIPERRVVESEPSLVGYEEWRDDER